MKFSLAATLGLSALAMAAPVDDQIKRLPYKRQASSALATGYAAPTGSYSAAATGGYYPTGTAAPYPISTGTSCSPNGAVICKGEDMFGICNWGKVTFQSVAAGTKCVNGEITAADS